MPHHGTINIDSVSALFEKGTYFDSFSAFHTMGHPAPGVEGELLPYALKNDVFVLGVLVASFLLICFVLNKGYLLIAHQIKEFFVERTRGNLFVETGTEFRYQFFLVTNTALLFGVIVYAIYFKPDSSTELISSWRLLLFCMGTSIVLYLLKFIVYSFVNWIFFEGSKGERWMEIYSLVVSLQGILFFPLACVVVYFNLNTSDSLIALLVVLFIAKLLLFCKSLSIFFVNLQGFLSNILYFCTLEMIPMLLLLKIIENINQSWTIIF